VTTDELAEVQTSGRFSQGVDGKVGGAAAGSWLQTGGIALVLLTFISPGLNKKADTSMHVKPSRSNGIGRQSHSDRVAKDLDLCAVPTKRI
jgi:hypothetical protein